MGLARLMLDLPALCSQDEALDWASTELRERHIHGWERLSLHTTEPTGSGAIRRFTFIYWTAGVGTRAPKAISYSQLWARLSAPERTAVLRLTRDGLLTGAIKQILTDRAGDTLFLPGSNGESRVPQTLRLFLRAISTERH